MRSAKTVLSLVCACPCFAPALPTTCEVLPEPIAQIVKYFALIDNVRPAFALKLAQEESGLDPMKWVIEEDGSISAGVMQVNLRWHYLTHPYEPWENIKVGMALLGKFVSLCHGNEVCAAFCYRHGHLPES